MVVRNGYGYGKFEVTKMKTASSENFVLVEE